MGTKRFYALKLITSICDNQDDYVAIIIKSKELVEKLETVLLTSNKELPIYIVVSGAKTSDFKSWGYGATPDEKLVSFGETLGSFGCLEIVNDTTLRWVLPQTVSVETLSYAKRGLKFMIKKSLKDKEITLSCNFIELEVSAKNVMNRISEILGVENIPYIDITLSGAKTSDFVAICKADNNGNIVEYSNFGEECYLGRLEIIDDITYRWYPPENKWDIVPLAIAQRGMIFLANNTLKGKVVTLS